MNLAEKNAMPVKGKAPVSVSVSDGHGGEAVASFSVEITQIK